MCDKIVRQRTIMPHPIPLAIRETSKEIGLAFEEAFISGSGGELKPLEGRLLCYLCSHPNCSSSDIQADHHLVKSTVSELLSSLSSKGLIEYRLSENDRREKVIVVTEFGREAERRKREVIDAFDRAMVEGLSEEEQDQLRSLLNKVRVNAGRRHADGEGKVD